MRLPRAHPAQPGPRVGQYLLDRPPLLRSRPQAEATVAGVIVARTVVTGVIVAGRHCPASGHEIVVIMESILVSSRLGCFRLSVMILRRAPVAQTGKRARPAVPSTETGQVPAGTQAPGPGRRTLTVVAGSSRRSSGTLETPQRQQRAGADETTSANAQLLTFAAASRPVRWGLRCPWGLSGGWVAALHGRGRVAALTGQNWVAAGPMLTPTTESAAPDPMASPAVTAPQPTLGPWR